MKNDFIKANATEALGVFLLSVAAFSVGRLDDGFVAGVLLITAVLGALILMFQGLSETIFNPAITIGLAIMGKINLSKMFSYLVFQIFGAVLAIGLIAWLVPDYEVNSQAVSAFEWKVFVIEMLGTSALSFAVALTVSKKTDTYKSALIIAFGLLLGLSFSSYIPNGGMLNPAVGAVTRNFGITQYDNQQIELDEPYQELLERKSLPDGSWYGGDYFFGSIAGGIAGVLIYMFLHEKEFNLPTKKSAK